MVISKKTHLLTQLFSWMLTWSSLEVFLNALYGRLLHWSLLQVLDKIKRDIYIVLNIQLDFSLISSCTYKRDKVMPNYLQKQSLRQYQIASLCPALIQLWRESLSSSTVWSLLTMMLRLMQIYGAVVIIDEIFYKIRNLLKPIGEICFKL